MKLSRMFHCECSVQASKVWLICMNGNVASMTGYIDFALIRALYFIMKYDVRYTSKLELISYNHLKINPVHFQASYM